ncbi:CoA transferase, partial [Mycobacterium timonense]
RARTDRGINLPPTVGQDPMERPKYAFYVTKDDKFVLLAAIEHKFWDNFCDVIERPDLREMKYLDSPVDFRNQGGDKNLAHILRPIMASRTLAEWMDIATKYDIPLSPANSVEGTLQDPHLRAREIIHESVHPVAGPFTTVGWPAPVDGQPFDVERHAPTLGEHTDEILAEIGYSADDIRTLREQGIV